MKLKSLFPFFSSQRGAITIEFSIVTVAFVSILYIGFDFGVAITTQGRLDRTAQSLSAIFRERSEFYQNSNDIYPELVLQDQVDELTELGRILQDDPRLEIKIDAIYLTATGTEPEDIENAIVTTDSFYSNGATNSSFLTIQNTMIPPESLKFFSPYSANTSRWIPIYRVTLVIPGSASLFSQLSSLVAQEKVISEIISSNIVISRCNLVGSCPGVWILH